MNDFIESFGKYYNEAQFDTFLFWAIPLGTLLFIWLFTIAGLKIFTKRGKLKTVFIANRAWMISSLIAAAVIISFICYWWSTNYLANHPLHFSLLISLIIALCVPIVCLLRLRNYYTQEGIKEITDQPKTMNQLDETIRFAKKAFRTNKLYYLIPLIGFIFLFFYFNKGTNLISFVYDNSSSMTQTNAIDALSETFDNLDENNEIILTTLEGYKDSDKPPVVKTSMGEIMSVAKSSRLKAGNVVAFSNPSEARGGLTQISNQCFGSPIAEAIWKTFLFLKETKTSRIYKNKLLIIITDGDDNIGQSLGSGKFFYDNKDFADYFPPDDVFVIDYSGTASAPLINRFQAANCDIYQAENNKQGYLDALNNALQSFKNNWFLIFWTVAIFLFFMLIGLLIQPKKIA